MRQRARRLTAEWDHIVEREVRRFGAIPGHDADDLAQEARIAVMRALPRIDAERGEGAAATYIRRAVLRTLINAKRDATTQGRAPHDTAGTRMPVASLSAPLTPDSALSQEDVLTDDGATTPEDEASARQLVRALAERLPRYEMEMLRATFVSGAKLARARLRGAQVDERIEQVRMRARAILSGLLNGPDRVDGETEDAGMTKKKLDVISAANCPDVALADLTDCHVAKGGAGYDPKDEGCGVKCPDKFSCLAGLVNERAKNTLKLTLDSDGEVAAVLGGEMKWTTFVERYNQRMTLIDEGKPVPANLLPTGPLPENAGKHEAPDESDDEDEDADKATEVENEKQRASEEPDADDETTTTETITKEDATMASKKSNTKKSAKKAPTKKAPPPPKGAKAKAAPKAAAKAKAPRGPRKRLDASKRVKLAGENRFAPQARVNTSEQMAAALGRVDLGQKFDLAVGMQIVRKRRGDVPVVVTIAKDGFVYEGVTYSSLSAAGQVATKRAVSGNDYFSIKSYGCTQIQGKGVPGHVVSRAGEGIEAGAEGTKRAKKAKAPPKPKAVSAKKAAPKKGKPPVLDPKKKGALAKAKAKAKPRPPATPVPTAPAAEA